MHIIYISKYNFLILQTIEKAQCSVDKTTIRPILTLIGNPISVAYYWLADHKFTFECPLEALENLFLHYMVLYLKYPDKSIHVWNYIQRGIFEIVNENDINLPSIERLINDLKY